MNKVYAYSAEKKGNTLRSGHRVKMVKDIFGAKKDKYTSAFLHYTIICFEQFATLYCYSALYVYLALESSKYELVIRIMGDDPLIPKPVLSPSN